MQDLLVQISIPYILTKYQNINIINLDSLTYAGDIDNLKDCENNKRYSFINADIRNRKEIELIFNENHIDGVIHFLQNHMLIIQLIVHQFLLKQMLTVHLIY